MIFKNKKATLLTVIAILVGITLGSLDQLSRLDVFQQPQSQAGDKKTNVQNVNRTSETQNHRRSGDQTITSLARDTFDQSTAEPSLSNTIFLPGNVTMAPLRENGVFVGYEILSEGSDDRLSAGDVITSLNGIPVEDSAAGGELAIAALVNPETSIELRGQ